MKDETQAEKNGKLLDEPMQDPHANGESAPE